MKKSDLFAFACVAALLLGLAVGPAFAGDNEGRNDKAQSLSDEPAGNSGSAGFGIGTAYQTNQATPDNSMPAQPETENSIGLGGATADQAQESGGIGNYGD